MPPTKLLPSVATSQGKQRKKRLAENYVAEHFCMRVLVGLDSALVRRHGSLKKSTEYAVGVMNIVSQNRLNMQLGLVES